MPGAAQTCTYSISPTSLAAAAAGARPGRSTVTAGAGCAWTATTATPGSRSPRAGSRLRAWLGRLQRRGQSGCGDERHLDDRRDRRSRWQSGAPPSCTYSINPASESVGFAGGGDTIAVNTANGCGWTATTSASWIGIALGHERQRKRLDDDHDCAQFGRGARRDGQRRWPSYTVTQAAAPRHHRRLRPPARTRSSPTSLSVGAGNANNRKIDVNTTSSCPWTASASGLDHDRQRFVRSG